MIEADVRVVARTKNNTTNSCKIGAQRYTARPQNMPIVAPPPGAPYSSSASPARSRLPTRTRLLAVGEREGLRVWVRDTVPVLLPEPVADPVEDTAADTDMYIEYEAKAEL